MLLIWQKVKILQSFEINVRFFYKSNKSTIKYICIYTLNIINLSVVEKKGSNINILHGVYKNKFNFFDELIG